MSQHDTFQRCVEMIIECCGKNLHKSGDMFSQIKVKGQNQNCNVSLKYYGVPNESPNLRAFKSYKNELSILIMARVMSILLFIPVHMKLDLHQEIQ
jgi:hypothetical protein